MNAEVAPLGLEQVSEARPQVTDSVPIDDKPCGQALTSVTKKPTATAASLRTTHKKSPCRSRRGEAESKHADRASRAAAIRRVRRQRAHPRGREVGAEASSP